MADLWEIPLPSVGEADGSAAATCSPDEWSRAARILPERIRARFLVVRSAVREILSRYAPGTRPLDLRLTSGPYGKPRLLDSTIAFNVSHTRTAALCCVARDEVGVDLERVRPVRHLLPIARICFNRREVEAIRRQPASLRHDAFFRLWTRKEACAKALGLGFALPFWSFAVDPDRDRGSVQELSAGGRRLRLRALPVGGGWAAALASPGDCVKSLRLWRYEPVKHEPS